MKAALFVTLILLSLSTQSAIVVIGHPDNSASLDKETLQRLYTGRSNSLLNGDAAIPLNLSDQQSLRSQFDEKALGRSSSQLKAFWSKLVFTGKGTPPKEVDSETEMITLISSTPNLIGYVSANADTAGVKVLMSIE
mgnify:FL=1